MKPPPRKPTHPMKGLEPIHLYVAKKLLLSFEGENGELPREASGTAFTAVTAKGTALLVTNKHVIDGSILRDHDSKFSKHRLKSLSVLSWRSPDDQAPSELNDCICQFKYSDTDDLVLIKIERMSIPKVQSTPPGLGTGLGVGFMIDRGRYDKIHIGDVVAFPGYPAGHGEDNRPLMRIGSIASDPARGYRYKGRGGPNCVAYEASSWGGSSGSPVFLFHRPGLMGQFEGLSMIGVNAGHVRIREEGGGYAHSNLAEGHPRWR